MPGVVRPSCEPESSLAYATACSLDTYGEAAVCSPDSSLMAAACQPGIYYWQDYDLLGEEWNNYFEIWETLS